MDIENHLEQNLQVSDLSSKLKQDSFLHIPLTPLVEEQDLKRDLNTPSPPAQTPPPPSTSPIGFWDPIDNYPATYTTPPPIQENPPHPYLEGNLCVDKSAAKLLELPPSDITDNSPPITTLQPPTWDQHESSLTQTRVTPSDGTPHLAAVNTEKQKYTPEEPRTLQKKLRVKPTQEQSTKTTKPAAAETNCPKPVLLLRPIAIPPDHSIGYWKPPSILQVITHPTQDLIERLIAHRIPYITHSAVTERPPNTFQTGQ